MIMRFWLYATTAAGAVLLALPFRTLATTAADLCPSGTGPCVVSRAVRVDDNSIIDTGARHLLIAAGGVLSVDAGTMTLMSDRLTIEAGGALRALGTGSDTGGTIVVNANVIAVVGRIESTGAPGGQIRLISTGDLTVTGAIDANSRSRDDDGGSIVLQGATVTLAGPVTANGGRDGLGGEIDVTSGGDLLVSRNLEASGGEGGAIDLTAGDGNPTVSQSGRLVADALTEDGTGDAIALEANGDGIANGHIIMNGLITVSGLAGGSAGEVTIDAAGDVRGADTTAHIIASGGRPNGAGGDVSITTTVGQYTCAAAIEARGNTAGPGGFLDLDVGGGITFAAPIDARGGTRGGLVSARAGGDVSVDSTLRTDGGMEGGALIEVEGCTVAINPTAVLSSTGPNGANRLTGRDLTVVRGALLADTRNGRNEIVYGGSRRRPVIFDSAQVIPSAVETEDTGLRSCGPVVTLTPTRTPTPTRGPRTATPTPTMPPSACVGDCDHNNGVVVNELILGVNIALLRQPLAACRAFDPNGSGAVSVDELVRAVNNALRGCAL